MTAHLLTAFDQLFLIEKQRRTMRRLELGVWALLLALATADSSITELDSPVVLLPQRRTSRQT